MKLPFDTSPSACAKMFGIAYGDIAAAAAKSGCTMAGNDRKKVVVLAIDMQGTFCVPTGELFVDGAPEDTSRGCEFVANNFNQITTLACTLDTHKGIQIFHPAMFVNAAGEHPVPFTVITAEDIRKGTWAVSPYAGYAITGNPSKYTSVQSYVTHYVNELEKGGRYPLLIWPYHAMLGGINHALVSAWEQTAFFHAMARGYNTHFETKGGMLPENYSVLRPEVLTGPGGTPFVQKNTSFFEYLIRYDATIVMGQAKSHCVAWTMSDLIDEIKAKDATLLKKVHILGDCTSSVKGFEKQGDDAFARFANDVNIIDSKTDVASLV